MVEKKENNAVWKYYWTAGGMLKAVQRPDGSVITFKYDAFGRRISKSYHRREFLYIWDKNVPLHEVQKEELCEDNVITWIFEGFTPTAKLINGKAYSIISDHIGTPLVAIDTQGNKVWERELDIYGRVRKEFTSDDVKDRRCGFMPFLYAGQYYDKETDLAYNRFRYYDPNTGSYISQDPIGLEGGLALYQYVTNTNDELDIFGLATVYLRNNEVYVGKAKQNAKMRYKSDMINSATDIFTDIPNTDIAQGVEDIVHDRLLLNENIADRVTNINKPVRKGDKKGRKKSGNEWLKQQFGTDYLEVIDKKIKDHYSKKGNGCNAK
ncbi:RHS repeat domain-containing protein [Capnocytophaga canimorsus]|uniref:RHS repeat domain-containing protein n=1 Tax=Capnocytophaga canimorsus TaxID=28188 RepID=UPI0037D2F872